MSACVLYDRECIDCGECEVCPYHDKICDNCFECLKMESDYAGILVDAIVEEEPKKND